MKPAESLTAATIRGVSWSWAASGVTLLMQFAYTAVMSRLLEPEAFGLVAAALVGLRFVSYLSRFGIASAVVQRQTFDADDTRVASTLAVLIGAGAAAIGVVVAPVLAVLIDQPDAAAVMRWLAIGMFVSSIGIVPHALLRRGMRFRALGGASVVSFALGYPIVGILGANLGWEVWSLVAATLTQQLAMAVMVIVLARPPLRPAFDRKRASPLLRFGGAVTATSFLEFLGSNLDTLAVGRWAGAAALGQYSRGTYLVSLPVEHLSTAASNVLLPSLSNVQADPVRFERGLLSSITGMGVIVAVPIAMGAAAADDLVRVVLGPGWELAASVVPLVAAAYGIALLTHVPGVAMEARGMVSRKLRIQAGALIFLLISLGVVVWTGPTVHRLAGAWLGAELIRHAAYWVAMVRLMDVSLRHLASRYAYVGVLATAAGTAMAGVSRGTRFSDLAALAVGGLISIATSGLVVALWKDSSARNDLDKLWRQRPSFSRR